MNQTLLAHDEQLQLLREAQQGDENAMEILVTKNAGLVKSIVRKFLNRDAEYEDLFQIGYMGLVKAIHNYDESFNVRFSTYAVPLVMGEIKRFLRDDGIIKVSRSIKEVRQQVAKTTAELKEKLQREPTVNEIAQVLDMDVQELVVAMESALPCLSIYEPIYEDEDSAMLLLDRLSDARQNNIENRIALKEMLSQLEARDRQIIIMRYFMDKTQSETAKKLGVSQVQVSRLEAKILKKMRTSMESS